MNLTIKQFSLLATLIVLFVVGTFIYSKNAEQINIFFSSQFNSRTAAPLTVQNNLNDRAFRSDINSLNAVAGELQLWKENGVIRSFADLKPTTIENIKIELTKEIQSYGTVKDDAGVILRSYSFIAEGGVGTLYLYFNPEYVAASEYIQPEINFAIVEALMKASLTKPSMTIEKQYEEINRIIDVHQLNQKPILIIQNTQSAIKKIANILVTQALAQGSCGGAGACGQSTTTGCHCTVGGSSCTNYGGSCGPGGAGSCTDCDYECLQTTLESCNGSSQASCTNSFTCGDCLVVNGCRWTVPPTPPPNRWTCGSGYSCVSSTTGYTSYATCDANCNPPPTPITYGCSGTSCVQQAGGPYTSPTCGGACTPVARYSCSGTSCVANASGPYTSSDCGGACAPTKYACSGNSCVVDSSGSYTSSNCNGDCDTKCDSCGCPGYPSCGCLDEHDCGDITQWDCCAGACVPEGSACGGGGCSAPDLYRGTYVWVRVVSQENGGTVAWKGTQANDPVINTNWSVQGLDPDGYFQTYKPSYTGTNKVFDKNKNVISQSMRLEVEQNPVAPQTYTNQCGDDRTFPDSWNIAHGGTWSNHFCTAGYTYAISGGLPTASNYYCENDIDGPVYFKEDDVTYPAPDPRGLDCDSTPRVWPLGDPDGCYEGLRIPLNNIPTGQDVVRKSAHNEIVPLLQYAAGAGGHWADMAFDGYWTYTYQAWEYYQNTDDIDTVLTLYPPVNHYCTDVRWFNNFNNTAQEQSPKLFSNADGSCTASFNPKGSGNLLVMEVARAKNQSCTVRFEDLDNPGPLVDEISAANGFNVQVDGNSSQVIPPAYDNTRLFFSKPDFSQYTGTLPPYFVEIGPYDGRYYYQYNQTAAGQTCQTNSEESCTLTATVGPNTLEDGDYDFFCDVIASSGTPLRCSGNTACSFNYYNSTANIANCSPTADCVDDSQIPRDHGDATVACVASCDACSIAGESDGCGGTCTSTGTYAQKPATPTIQYPTGGSQYVPAGETITTQWTLSQLSDPSYLGVADYFDVITYRQGAYTGDTQTAANAAWADRTNTSKIQNYQSVTALSGTTSYVRYIPAPTSQTIGRDLTVAIRAVNSPSGTNACVGNAVIYGDWVTTNYTLVSYVSGAFYDDPTDSGDTSTLVPANFPGGTVTVGPGISGFNVTKTVLTGETTYSYNNIPWKPLSWSPSLTRTFNIAAPLDPADTFLCSGGNDSGINTTLCTNGDVYTPEAGANFFVKSYNLAFDSWWQAWGGNVFGKTNLVSDVPGTNSPCQLADADDCSNVIVARNRGQLSPTAQSAGVPVTGGATITTDDSDFSELPGNPRAAEQEVEGITEENYTYFISGTNLTASKVAATSQTRAQFRTTLDNEGDLQDDSITKVIRYDNSLTLNLTTVNDTLSIDSDEKYVIFIEGDLLINGPTSHTATDQDRLISVANGGYLAFITEGNITFSSSIGYDDPDKPDYADEGLSQTNTPNIEGVYIASGNLIVQSLDASSSTPGDFKFVGAGTFVGWTGVQLERNYDSSNILRRQLNNLSATELFIHRPDLVTNTPAFMMRPQLTWQEVP